MNTRWLIPAVAVVLTFATVAAAQTTTPVAKARTAAA